MKILAVQGSPRPLVSNTETLLREFLKGAESQSALTETIYLREKNIHWCQGCYTCWTKTPGVCVFMDDMPALLEKVKECDILVYATPLYGYNVTALTKLFQDRLLPLVDPHMVKGESAYKHPARYPEKKRKTVLISNCGFPEASQFDALRHLFRKIESQGGAPLVGEILMPAGELLKVRALKSKTGPVLEAVFRAGVEVVRDGLVSAETEAIVRTPIIEPDEMAAMANLSWDSLIQAKGSALRPGKMTDVRLALRGMAAAFDPGDGADLIATIQFHLTGGQPGHWFLSIHEGTCTMNDGVADTSTLTITTLSEVWLAISNKELDGQKAFAEGKMTALGDMGLLMRLGSLFSS
jgi:multimeric flavodoxin WrbA